MQKKPFNVYQSIYKQKFNCQKLKKKIELKIF